MPLIRLSHVDGGEFLLNTDHIVRVEPAARREGGTAYALRIFDTLGRVWDCDALDDLGGFKTIEPSASDALYNFQKATERLSARPDLAQGAPTAP